MKTLICSFFAMLLLFSPFFLCGQQAKRGNLTARDMVVTNEVDPTAELHWDAHAKVTWKTVYSNGYIEVYAVTNINLVGGRK